MELLWDGVKMVPYRKIQYGNKIYENIVELEIKLWNYNFNEDIVKIQLGKNFWLLA